MHLAPRMALSPVTQALFELSSGACRWPMGAGWCGEHAAEGRSYCAHHYETSIDREGHEIGPRMVSMILQRRSGAVRGAAQR
jgi:hypothetical protein